MEYFRDSIPTRAVGSGLGAIASDRVETSEDVAHTPSGRRMKLQGGFLGPLISGIASAVLPSLLGSLSGKGEMMPEESDKPVRRRLGRTKIHHPAQMMPSMADMPEVKPVRNARVEKMMREEAPTRIKGAAMVDPFLDVAPARVSKKRGDRKPFELPKSLEDSAQRILNPNKPIIRKIKPVGDGRKAFEVPKDVERLIMEDRKKNPLETKPVRGGRKPRKASTRQPSAWSMALKEWNASRESWSIPRKGTPEYEEVRALM